MTESCLNYYAINNYYKQLLPGNQNELVVKKILTEYITFYLR